jgi:hypothetical protein
MNTKANYIESNLNQLGGFSNVNHFNDEKIRFVKETISRELTSESKVKMNIDTRLFNKCSRDFIETEKGVFVHNVKSEVTSFEITHLKNQNLLLKQLIAELSNENHLLREKLAEKNDDKI